MGDLKDLIKKGSLEQLATDLEASEATQNALISANPYYAMKKAPDTFTDVALKAYAANPDLYSKGEMATVGGVGGLLSGIFGHFGDEYHNTLSDRLYQSAATGERSENLSAGLWNRAQSIGAAAKAKRSQKLADTELDLALTEETEKRKVLGKNKAYTELKDTSGTKRPVLGELSEKLQSLEDATYKRITGLPGYRTFSDIRDNFGSVVELAKEDSRAASIGMISAIARVWDPGGTVKEGEYHLNTRAQSFLDSVYGEWKELVHGEGKLSPRAKRDMINAAKRKFDTFGMNYMEEREALYSALEKQGGKREYIPTTLYKPLEVGDLSFLGPSSSEPTEENLMHVLEKAKNKKPLTERDKEILEAGRAKYGG